MTTPRLPRRQIAVLDNEKSGTKEIAEKLRERFDQKRNSVQIVEFRTTAKARKELQSTRNEMCGLVIDWVGTQPANNSVAKLAKRVFPKMPIILFSTRAELPENLPEVIRLQNEERLVDRFVNKNKDAAIENLADVVEELYQDYDNDPVIQSVRNFLQTCDAPDSPFIILGDRHMSLVELYSDIVRETRRGKVAKRVWQTLVVRSLSRKGA